MKKKIITAVLGICLTTTAFGGILTTQAGGLSSILGGAAKIGGIGIVVNKFGPQIAHFIHQAYLNFSPEHIIIRCTL